jgi:predicted lipoprotein
MTTVSLRTDPFLKSRSVLVAALIGIASAGSFGQTADAQPFTRQAMLRDIATKVFAPGWQDVAAKCRGLTNSLNQFIAAPNQASLDHARKSWLAAAQAANRMRCFQAGPLAEPGSASSFYYWQVLPFRIEALLKSPSPINQALVDELGSTSKGLFALEYLLFDDKGGNPGQPVKLPPALELMTGPGSERRCSFLLALARDLEVKASQLASDWAMPADRGAVAKFTTAGQDSVNLLVNQLAAALEDVAEKRLHFVLLLRPPISEDFHRIERSRSGSSLEGVLASLNGIQQLFCGADGLGLDDAIRRLNASLEKRVQDHFEQAIGATRAIGAPFEEVVVDKRPVVEKAYEEVRALEILLKVDVASALGVTLTFSSNDGD